MRKKAAIAGLLTLALCALPFLKGSPGQAVEAQGEIRVYVEGTLLELQTPPFIESSAAIVPVREIAEALGAKVTFRDAAKEGRAIDVTRGNRSAKLVIGSKTMNANGRSVALPVAPRLANGVALVPARAISEALGSIVVWDSAKHSIRIDDPKELPSVGTVDHLMKLLDDAEKRQSKMYSRVYATADLAGSAEGGAVSGESSVQEAEAPVPGGDNYSTTNVQVAGVDEADWAKTDGSFIYQISGNRVIIADISVPENPKLAATLDYGERDAFMPQELYVDNGQLVVIGQQSLSVYEAERGGADSTGDAGSADQDSGTGNANSGGGTSGSAPRGNDNESSAISAEPSVAPDAAVKSSMMFPLPYQTRSTIKTFVYDINDQGQPKLVRELAQEGSYLSSRKIGSDLYIVTNKDNYVYGLYDMMTAKASNKRQAAANSQNLEQAMTLLYKDSAVSEKPLALTLDDIRYFPEPEDASMMIVGAVDLSKQDGEYQVSAYMGAGQTVYASKRNLYVAVTKFVPGNGGEYKQETVFHKFRLDNGQTIYSGQGSVPGALLNQFSMDEHDGYLRVALTNGNMWSTGSDISVNNLYVLDEGLQISGKLEGLAPGERIYSVRFMGARAYMVTFRNVDPLFAIDLREPANPVVLGQLKIPGYSDYLHPYDENHLIGFGKDTDTLPVKTGNGDDVMAYYQGLKMALFDVSDVSQPKEKFKELIGDRGTESELLRNHKALLFSKAKGLLAFPVELHEVKNKNLSADEAVTAYGDFVNQAAYVYGIDLDKGFTLRGTISHLSAEDLLKSGQYGYDYSKAVRRILYAGDTLYTLSDAMLKANNLNSLSQRGSLLYPGIPSNYGYNYGGAIDMVPVPETDQ
ncbi:beta-propeller domain-containing protein [Paenibacillus sp. CAU 1782]